MIGFGEKFWGGFLWGGKEAVGVTPLASYRDDQSYFIEIWDSSDDVLARLPYWGNGKWGKHVYNPASLSFSYPIGIENDSNWEELVRPNQVVLFDGNGTKLGIFHISDTVKRTDSEGQKIIEVNCVNVISQLGFEHVESKDFGTSVSLRSIIQTLLNDYQDNGTWTDIGYGSIHSAFANTSIYNLKVENQSILQVLNGVRDRIGGYFYVGINRKLYWVQFPVTSRPRQEFRIDKNIVSLEIRTDYKTVFTRVKAYGSGGTNETRLTATADSANIGTQGVIQKVISDPRIRSTTELQRWAEQEVRRLSVPSKEINLEAIDLSRLRGSVDYSHENIEIPSRIRVIHEDLDEEIVTNILGATFNLDVPGGVSIQIGNPAPVESEIAEGGEDLTGSQVYQERKTPAQIISSLIDDSLTNRTTDWGFESTILDLIDPDSYDDGYLDSTEYIIWQNHTEIPDEPIYGNFEDALIAVLSPDEISDTLKELLEGTGGDSDQVIQNTSDIADLQADMPSAGTGAMEPVTFDVGTAGSSTDYAPMTHDHQGMPFISGVDRAALKSVLENGGIGFTTSAPKGVFVKIHDDVYAILTAFSTTEALLKAMMEDGEFGYISEEPQAAYIMIDGELKPISVVVNDHDTIINGATLLDGTLIYANGNQDDQGDLQHFMVQDGNLVQVQPGVENVAILPSVPEYGMKEVFWRKSGGDAGDEGDRIYRAYAGDERYTPVQPGVEEEASFPAIPTTGTRIIRKGDQNWMAHFGDSMWTAMQSLTNEDGAPPA